MEATDKDLMEIFASEQRRDPCQDITDYAGTARRAMRRAYELGRLEAAIALIKTV